MWRAVPGIIFLGIIVVLFFTTLKKADNDGGQALLKTKAPELYITKIEGYSPIPSRSILFNNQYVLVNFFASWCTPCLAEHPYLNQLSKEYDLRIAGIVWRDKADNVRSMLAEHGNPYDFVGIDKMDATAFGYGVKGLPESFLIAPDGTVVATHRGPLVPSVIKEKILPHIQ